MSHACTPILVSVTSLVLEILLLSKTANFPFLTMDYSPWSSKNLIDQNWLKKFMHVGIDVKFMHTNFDGRALFGFGDIATFKNGQFSLSDFFSLFFKWKTQCPGKLVSYSFQSYSKTIQAQACKHTLPVLHHFCTIQTKIQA